MTTTLLTTRQAAQALAVSRDSVLRLVHSGALRHVNVGTGGERERIRIREDDLAAFIEARTATGAEA